MDNMIDPQQVKAGDEVYVIYRSPHTPSLANIKQAEIVEHPFNPDDVALFLQETFHVIEEEDAFFSSELAAQEAYNDIFVNQPYDDRV